MYKMLLKGKRTNHQLQIGNCRFNFEHVCIIRNILIKKNKIVFRI
jgi:hypothetical protein